MSARTEGDLDQTLAGLGGWNATSPDGRFRPRYGVIAIALVAFIAGGALVWSQLAGDPKEMKKVSGGQKKAVTATVEPAGPTAETSGPQASTPEEVAKLYKATQSKIKVNCNNGYCYSTVYLTIKNVDGKTREFWMDFVGLDSNGVIVYEGVTSTGKLAAGEAKKLALTASDNENGKNEVVKIQIKPIRISMLPVTSE